MLEDYLNSVKERDSQGIPPLPLDAEQTSGLIELIKDCLLYTSPSPRDDT